MITLGILRSCLVNQIILHLLVLCNTTKGNPYNLETNRSMVFSALLKMHNPNSNSLPVGRLIDLPFRLDVLGGDEGHPREPRVQRSGYFFYIRSQRVRKSLEEGDTEYG